MDPTDLIYNTAFILGNFQIIASPLLATSYNCMIRGARSLDG